MADLLPSQFQLLVLREDQRNALEELRILRLHERAHILDLGDIAFKRAKNQLSSTSRLRSGWRKFLSNIRRRIALKKIIQYCSSISNVSLNGRKKQDGWNKFRRFFERKKRCEAATVLHQERRLRAGFQTLKNFVGLEQTFLFRRANRHHASLLQSKYMKKWAAFKNKSRKYQLNVIVGNTYLCRKRLRRSWTSLLTLLAMHAVVRRAQVVGYNNRQQKVLHRLKQCADRQFQRKYKRGIATRQRRNKKQALRRLIQVTTARLDRRKLVIRTANKLLHWCSKRALNNWISKLTNIFVQRDKIRLGQRKFCRLITPKYLNVWKAFRTNLLDKRKEIGVADKSSKRFSVKRALGQWIAFVFDGVERRNYWDARFQRGPPLGLLRERQALDNWIIHTSERMKQKQKDQHINKNFQLVLLRKAFQEFQTKRYRLQLQVGRVKDFLEQRLKPLLCWRVLHQLQALVDRKKRKELDVRVHFRSGCLLRLTLWRWKGVKRRNAQRRTEIHSMEQYKQLTRKLTTLSMWKRRHAHRKLQQTKQREMHELHRFGRLIPSFRRWRERTPLLQMINGARILGVKTGQINSLIRGWYLFKGGLEIIKKRKAQDLLVQQFRRKKLLQRTFFCGLKNFYLEASREYLIARHYWALSRKRRFFKRHHQERIYRLSSLISRSARAVLLKKSAFRRFREQSAQWLAHRRQLRAKLHEHNIVRQVAPFLTMRHFAEKCRLAKAHLVAAARDIFTMWMKRSFRRWLSRIVRFPEGSFKSSRRLHEVVSMMSDQHREEKLILNGMDLWKKNRERQERAQEVMQRGLSHQFEALGRLWFYQMSKWTEALQSSRQIVCEAEDFYISNVQRKMLAKWQTRTWKSRDDSKKSQYFMIHSLRCSVRKWRSRTTASSETDDRDCETKANHRKAIRKLKTKFNIHVGRNNNVSVAMGLKPEAERSSRERKKRRDLPPPIEFIPSTHGDYRRSTQLLFVTLASSKCLRKKLGQSFGHWRAIKENCSVRQFKIWQFSNHFLVRRATQQWKAMHLAKKRCQNQYQRIDQDRRNRNSRRRFRSWNLSARMQRLTRKLHLRICARMLVRWKKTQSARRLMRSIITELMNGCAKRKLWSYFLEWKMDSSVEQRVFLILREKNQSEKKCTLKYWRKWCVSRRRRLRHFPNNDAIDAFFHSRRKSNVLNALRKQNQNRWLQRNELRQSQQRCDWLRLKLAFNCLLVARRCRIAEMIHVRKSFHRFQNRWNKLRRRHERAHAILALAKSFLLWTYFRRFRRSLRKLRRLDRVSVNVSQQTRTSHLQQIEDVDNWREDSHCKRSFWKLRRLRSHRSQQREMHLSCQLHLMVCHMKIFFRRLRRLRSQRLRRQRLVRLVDSERTQRIVKTALHQLDLLAASRWAGRVKAGWMVEHVRSTRLRRGFRALASSLNLPEEEEDSIQSYSSRSSNSSCFPLLAPE